MKTKFLLLIIFCSLAFAPFCFSAHIAGGEMSYIYLGNNEFKVTLKLYRDCYNSAVPFDDPATIGIYNDASNLFGVLYFPLTRIDSISNSSFNCTSTAPANVCYQIGTYEMQTTLFDSTGNLHLVYQRCCRQYQLTNIYDPMSTGITINTTISKGNSNQSSPVFKNLPFTFICQYTPLSYDNSAADSLDGDSLVYSLCTPLLGGNTTDPQPNPPSSPPYDSITWLPPYSLSNIMGGAPLSIDAQTGLLTGEPYDPGLFGYCVCVKEYRNGFYLGETRRDFQVTVIPWVGIENLLKDNLIINTSVINSENLILKINSQVVLDNAELVLYNLLGEQIARVGNITTREILIKRKNIANGTYCYRFFNKGVAVYSNKIILY